VLLAAVVFFQDPDRVSRDENRVSQHHDRVL